MMQKTILIVEDDRDTRTIYGDALRDRGYNVLIAIQGAEGVHMARRHRPDLILMDIRMPVMDGWDAIRYLRSDSQTKDIPIWALSGFSPDAAGSDDRSDRFDRFIAKPLAPAQLVGEIEALIGPGSASP